MKKILQIIINTISFIIFIAGMAIVVLYGMGIKPSIVISGSMRPKLPIGSLCFIDTRYPIDNVKINDVIVYTVNNQKVIHRVVKIVDKEIRTKGDANSYVDGTIVTSKNYYGKCLFSIDNMGFVTIKLQSTTGKTIFVTTIIVIFILQDLINYAVKKEKNNGNHK